MQVLHMRYSRVSVQKRHYNGSTHCVGCGCKEREEAAPRGPEGGRPGEATEATRHRGGDVAEGAIVPCLPDGTDHFARERGSDDADAALFFFVKMTTVPC
jgi:hypothetical protein